jgi:hypothetical protein
LAARKAGKIQTLIVQGVLHSSLAAAADILLPGCAFIEKDAAYTNMTGHVQAAARAITPPGDAVEDWQILAKLSVVFGGSSAFTSSAAVRQAIAEALAAGVDGMIVVDLPPEESDLMLPHAKANGLDFIRLVAPTTDDERLPHVLNGSSGFVYYISITGITGTRAASREQLTAAIPRIRNFTDLPIAIGFGVRSPAQAAEASTIADAAVVASALIDTLSRNLDADGKAMPGAVEAVLDQVRELAKAVRGASNAP